MPKTAYIPQPLEALGTADQIRATVMYYLQTNLTESRTDEWIALLRAALDKRLPWYVPTWLAVIVLDRLVPDLILRSLDDLLRRLS